MKTHPTPLTWFRFQAGDLPLLGWLSFRLHVLRCASCGARLEAEQRERAAVELALDGARPAARRPRRRWVGLPAVAALAAVALLPIVLRSRSVTPAVDPATQGEGLREKGGSAFLVYVATDGGAAVLGDRCESGDALQAEYRSDKPFLLVVGVDPERRTRTLVPLDGVASTPISRGVALVPQSWVLDDGPGRERFVAFFSDTPLDSSRAHAASLAERPSLGGAAVVVRECTKGLP